MTETDPAALYRGIRTRITELVRDLPERDLDRVTPATPAWRVRDVVAHLAGATADIVSGTLDGVATDPWTDAQVAARRHTPLAEVLEEWGRCSATVEPVIADLPGLARAMLLVDAATHEQDLRGALGVPGEREGDAIAFAFASVTRGIGRQLGETGTLRLEHEAGASTLGTGAVLASVRTSRFEVVRAAVGRRSPDQVGAWDWTGTPLVGVMVLAAFSPPRQTPLVE